MGVPTIQGLIHSRQAPSRKVCLKKKKTKQEVRGGDFEEALAVYFRLWGKVVAVPGPLPAPSPHRREKPASPRLQEGGERGL